MMGNMIMRNVVKEVASNPAKERSIDSCESAAKEGPLFIAIVWDGGIRVMKVCEHDNPVISEKIGYNVKPDECGKADLSVEKTEEASHDTQSNI